MQTDLNQKYSFDYNEYKKNFKKKPKFSFLIFTTIIILLMVVAFFVMPNQTIKKMDELYFVQVNEYLTYSEASKMSIEIQNKDGAGFVYFDVKYRVFVSYYPTESEALSVVSNIKTDYPSATVYTLEVKKISKLSSLNSSENKMVEKTINALTSLIKNCYETLITFDKNDINSNQLSNSITTYSDSFNDVYSNFKSTFKMNKSANIINACEELEDITDALNSLKSASKTQDKCKLRYELINIVFNYSSFLSCF